MVLVDAGSRREEAFGTEVGLGMSLVDGTLGTVVVFIVESEHWQVDMREALERYVPQQKEAIR